MSIQLKENKNSIVLETNYVKIEFSNKDSKVLSVIDKRDGKSVMAEEETYFFVYADKDNAPTHKVTGIELTKNGLSLDTELGKMDVKVEIFDDWFSIEVLKKLPKDAYKFVFGNVKFNYDLDDKNALRAADVAMTVNANPNFYPSGLSCEIKGSCQEHLGGGKGAKIGFTVVPETILRETLKTVCENIDPEKGIVSKNAGPWARDSRLSFGDYMITGESTAEYIDANMDFFRDIGVDQIDFHQGAGTVNQGDFKYKRYDDDEGWNKGVIDKLRANGMEAGLHTYAYYINANCHEILSDPKWQAQLDRDEEFTLAEDISAEDTFIPTVESTADMSDYFGFFVKNLWYILIDEEIIKFENHPQGFKNCVRGIGGTKPVAHKKGAKVIHLIGCFYLFSPKPDTELFKVVAHNTANTYNGGNFAMIYLDALDGISRHCDAKEEGWYYCAVFVHEIVKNCKTYPIIEYSTMYPSIWAARARMGAWDTSYRNYKKFLDIHHEHHKPFTRAHFACSLGWYNFYPMTDNQPGNFHTKYHHWDAIDYKGAMAVMYDYSTVFNGISKDLFIRHEGVRRNLLRYKVYSDLRKEGYFSEDILEKARANEHELAIVKKGNKYVFEEKNYDIKKLYEIRDEKRNTEVFENPFKKQTPFIRIEAGMSTLGDDAMLLLPLDETKPIADQLKTHELGAEIDFTNNLAFTVRVKGNGKPGKIGIKIRCASNSEHGYILYSIDTNFEGWRDFVLHEVDNGDAFTDGEGCYPTYRTGIHVHRINKIHLQSEGDIEGVLMSSIRACRQVYNVVKNPTVTIGKESVMFECELMSTDFIEWDGETAKVIDRYANEKQIWFQGTVTAPKGKYKATLTCQSSLNNCPVNAYLTIGTKGNIIK
ncbi:MAG: hypothetical protein IKV53_02935 [Clostridia bacterium]|nr:hypothetical protein [Clostridia bacterium]